MSSGRLAGICFRMIRPGIRVLLGARTDWVVKCVIAKRNGVHVYEVMKMLQTSFLVIITLRFTCGERKICSTIKKSKNVNMIAAFLCIDICTLAIKYGHCSTNQIVHILHFNDNRIWTWNYSAPHREPKSGCNVLLSSFSSKLASYLTSAHRPTITH